jgi:hypothetical protein
VKSITVKITLQYMVSWWVSLGVEPHEILVLNGTVILLSTCGVLSDDMVVLSHTGSHCQLY